MPNAGTRSRSAAVLLQLLLNRVPHLLFDDSRMQTRIGGLSVTNAADIDRVAEDGIEFTPAERAAAIGAASLRSEEHTSELQSPMRISYAVLCLKKKTNTNEKTTSIL